MGLHCNGSKSLCWSNGYVRFLFLKHRVVSFWQTAVLKEGCARVLEITSRPSISLLLLSPYYIDLCTTITVPAVLI